MKRRKSVSVKRLALSMCKTAYCRKLKDGTGFIVWPGRMPGPRGEEKTAIGLGETPQQAWMSAVQILTMKQALQSLRKSQ